MKKVIFRILLNSLLGAVLIFVWTKFVDLGQIFQILKTIKLEYVFLFFGMFIFSTVLRSLRLRFLLNNEQVLGVAKKIPVKDILMLNYLGQFLSFVIPIRAGEMTKGIYLSTQFDLPIGKTLIWVFIDRFLDFWTFLLIASVLLLIVPSNIPSNVGNLLALILLTFTLIAIFSIKNEKFLKGLTNSFSSLLIIPKLKTMFISFTHTIIEGFSILRRHPKDLVLMLGLSVVAAISDGLIWLVMFSSLGIKIEALQTILGNSLIAFTFLVPAAPGYVGSAEAAGLAVFGGVLGVEANLASAATVLFHILTVIILLILGLTSLYFLKFDLNLVWKKLLKRGE